MSEERKTGREAQMSNIRAAVQVAETVRSTLGPAGMDKMLVDERGETIVTNDGITILRELDTAHPGAQMMVQASQTQEEVCKDGTTSVVVLAGQMLALSEGLLMRGIHPQVIVRAFNKASKIALRNMPITSGVADVAVEHVAATALRGKASESSLGFAAQLVGDAAHRVNGELDRVRILTQAGGNMDSSYIHEGLVLNKTFVNPDYEGGKRHHPRILLLDGGLDGFNYEDVQMQISDPSQLEQIRQQEMQILSNVSSVIAEMCDVVIVRDGVHEAVAKYLDSQDVGVISRVQQSDFDAISRITGVSAYHRITDVPEDAHLRIEGTVASIKIGDLDYVSVSAKESDTLTLIIRGATRQTLDEYERAFEDALGVACLFMKDDRLYPGGGAVMSKLSMTIRKHATESPDMTARERMCMEAYADSLEIIPAAIASNAGMDPLDVVMELRSCSDLEGLYIDFTGEGKITNTAEFGVWEPAALIEQIINSATEVACSILRIDDIIARRGQ